MATNTVVDRNEWDLDPSNPKPVPPSVNKQGERILPAIHGLGIRRLITHLDARGSLTELCDLRWDDVTEPMVYTYLNCVRAGAIKGWNRHHKTVDRLVIVQGDMQIVLYDDREDSPTNGMVNNFTFGPQHRVLLTIPTMVWHAVRNLSPHDGLFINHPTVAYDHERPDRDLLPLDNDLIPYRFR